MTMINLISDTVTRPTAAMKQYMMEAPLGDDVFGEDPSVNELESYAAGLFGKEAALFCPSGTMTNQIAIKINTQPLDEIVCDHFSHVYQYETAGYAYNSGVGVNLIEGMYGKITAEQVEAAIKPVHDWLPATRCVVLENSTNKGGGNFYTLDEIRPIADLCRRKDLKLHLDGARLFNVLVETGEHTEDVGSLFDTVSICLSKGLGAPVGSLLIGRKDDIVLARRFRKVMGGGMRQSGILAAAGKYALTHHVDRLKIDNDRARTIGKLMETLDWVRAVKPVRTNIVIFELAGDRTSDWAVARLKERSVNSAPFGPKMVRFVFHLDVTDDMMEELEGVLRGMGNG